MQPKASHTRNRKMRQDVDLARTGRELARTRALTLHRCHTCPITRNRAMQGYAQPISPEWAPGGGLRDRRTRRVVRRTLKAAHHAPVGREHHLAIHARTEETSPVAASDRAWAS